MWYRISVREELKENILKRLPSSIRRESGVERYVHDYVHSLELGDVKPGSNELIKDGTKYVYRRIIESKKK